MVNEISWEFDGRCPKCGSEDLIGNEDDGYECVECKYEFIVVIDLGDALGY